MDTQNLQAWRERRSGKIITTRTGLVCKIGPVAIHELTGNGTIPIPLLDKYEEMRKIDPKTMNAEEQKDLINAITAMYECVVLVALIEPKVTEFATDTTIQMSELQFEDKEDIFVSAQEYSEFLAKFREQQKQPTPTGQSST